MPTITSTASGDWNTGATWVGGVKPANGDSAVIASGHTVTLDADLITDGIALAALTITGILDCKTTGGPYSIKMDGVSGHNITGAGQLKAGTSGTPLPNSVKFTINLNGQSIINQAAGLLIALYCTEPTNKYIFLSQAESIAATALHVGTDITGDTPWVDTAMHGGTRVRIDNVNKGAQGEERTISTGTVPTSTIITVTAGLTAAKLQNSLVILVSRNIRITGGTLNPAINASGGAASYYGVEISGLGAGVRGLSSVSGSTVAGCIVSPAHAINAGNNCTVSGVLLGGTHGSVTNNNFTFAGLVSGCTDTGVYAGQMNIVSGRISGCATGLGGGAFQPLLTSTGTITGCATGVSAVAELSGAINNCTTGIYAGYPCVLRGAVLANNTYDLYADASIFPKVIGYGASLQSSTPFQYYSYTTLLSTNGIQAVLYDADGVAGRIQAWMNAGKVTTVSDVYPTGFTTSYKFWFEKLPTQLWLDIPIYVEARATTISVSIKKSANGMTETPSAQIIDPNQEIFSAGSVLTSATMADDTNWQTLTLSYTAAYARQLILRVRGRNASGNLWFNFAVSSGGGIIRVGMNGGLVG